MSKLSSAETTGQPRVNESGDSDRVPSYGKRKGFASVRADGDKYFILEGRKI